MSMNLIQIQEQIKGLPLQAVMSYANGMNPEVPPYVALAELNRRKQTEQQAGAANSQQPQQTVANQVKQQTALMAQQQQQMQQAPQGGGGVEQLPVANDMYSDRAFASGGIVAFADGGSTNKNRAYIQYEGDSGNLLPDNTGYEGMGIGEFLQSIAGAGKDKVSALLDLIASGESRMKKAVYGEPPVPGSDGRGKQDMSQYVPRDQMTPGPTPTAQPAPAAGIPEVPSAPAPSGIAALGSKAAPASASPAAPAQPSSEEAFLASLREQAMRPGMSAEDRAAQLKKAQEMFGVREPGAAQDKRIQQIEQMERERQGIFKKQQEGRGIDNLIQMGRAFATAPGGKQAGVAFAAGAGKYGDLKKEQNAEDLSQADKRMLVAEKMSELRNTNEAKQDAYRQNNLAEYLKLEAKEKELQAKLQEMAGNNAASMGGHKIAAQASRDSANIHADAARYSADKSLEGHKVMAAATSARGAAGSGARDDANRIRAEQVAQSDPRYKALAKAYEMYTMAGNPKDPKAAQLSQAMESIVQEKLRGMGFETTSPAPAAAPAATPTGFKILSVK